MESLAWMNMRIACLMESNLVSGRPFEPVLFISTRDSTSTSTHNNMSSLHIREGFNVYLLLTSELSPCTTTSISLSLSLSVLWWTGLSQFSKWRPFGWWYKRCVFSSFYYLIFLFSLNAAFQLSCFFFFFETHVSFFNVLCNFFFLLGYDKIITPIYFFLTELKFIKVKVYVIFFFK